MRIVDDKQSKKIPEKQLNPARKRRPIVRIILSLLILAGGVVGASYLKNSAPRTQKRPPVKLSSTVQVLTVTRSDYQIVVTAMGTVIPAREVLLKSRVSGEIVEIHPEFTEGG